MQRRNAPPNVGVVSDGHYALPFSKLLALYHRAYFVIVTHHGTNHPFGINALVEAMALGKAVLLTEGKGIDIDPASLNFGVKVPAHDVTALAAAMNRLLADRNAAIRMGNNARRLVESDFNTRIMSRQICRALRAALE